MFIWFSQVFLRPNDRRTHRKEHQERRRGFRELRTYLHDRAEGPETSDAKGPVLVRLQLRTVPAGLASVRGDE